MAYHWLETEVEEEEWGLKDEGILKVSNEYFFNNANIILNHEANFKQ